MKSDAVRAAQIFENVLADRGCEQAYNEDCDLPHQVWQEDRLVGEGETELAAVLHAVENSGEVMPW